MESICEHIILGFSNYRDLLMSIEKNPTVTVLMSTYNGEKYLQEQIDSLENQEDVHVHIVVRDDQSTDKTIEILNRNKEKYGNIEVVQGKNIGAIKSFMKLSTMCFETEYYAFCDQDDKWLPEKLKIAISKLDQYSTIPAMYYSETVLVDKNLKVLKNSSQYGKAYSFGQILVKNHVPGCTMVFNKMLKEKIKDMPYEYYRYMPYHDHWLYIICRMYHGVVIYDSKPRVMYRQHDDNTIGDRNLVTVIKQSGLFDNSRTRSNRAKIILNEFNDIPDDSQELLTIMSDYTKSPAKVYRFITNKQIKPISTQEKIIFDLLTVLRKV